MWPEGAEPRVWIHLGGAVLCRLEVSGLTYAAPVPTSCPSRDSRANVYELRS